HDSHSAIRERIRVLTRFGDRANDVWRAAKTPQRLLPRARPAKLDGHGAKISQCIRVEKSRAVQADPGQHAVVERLLDDVSEAGFTRDLKHPPIPHQVTDGGAGFVVRS